MDLQVQGRRVHAYTGGRPFDAALPCVVFLHGALHDHSVWTLLARWWAHHGRSVLALDLPGHGRSEGAALADIPALADWVLAVLDAAGVPPLPTTSPTTSATTSPTPTPTTALVGHSMGSLIALEAAARAPGRVGRLVMVGTAVPMKVSADLLTTALERPLEAIDRVNAYSHATHASKPSFPGPGMWLHGGNRILMRRMQAQYARLQGADQPGANLFHIDFTVCDRYAGGLEAAARVAAAGCRSSLVLGERDQMTPPRAAREMAVALAATQHLVPCGHALMQEAPDAVLRATQAALA